MAVQHVQLIEVTEAPEKQVQTPLFECVSLLVCEPGSETVSETVVLCGQVFFVWNWASSKMQSATATLIFGELLMSCPCC